MSNLQGTLESQILQTFTWLKSVQTRIKFYINKNHNWIPFSNLILWYLNLPVYIRVTFFILTSYLSINVVYNIGFVILQSKAKNEVLSIISAYHNPIYFPEELYYLYAFIFLFIILINVVIVASILFYAERIYLLTILPKLAEKKIMGTILYILVTMVFLGSVSYLISIFIPFVPYYLMYSSKNPALLQEALKGVIYNQVTHFLPEYISYDDIRMDLVLTLQLWIFIVTILTFITKWIYKLDRFYGRINNLNPNLSAQILINEYIKNTTMVYTLQLLVYLTKIKNLIRNWTAMLFIFISVLIILTIIVTQLLFPFGAFGKNLNKFETDYVVVTFTQSTGFKPIKGFRVFQDSAYIIIRDDDNVIHYIKTDELRVNAVVKDVQK